MTAIDLARELIRRIERAEPIEDLLHDDAVHEELPNRMSPSGRVHDRAAVLAGFERGRKLMARQVYAVRSAIGDGDRAAFDLDWSGTLAAPLGELPAGHVMKARIALFVEARGGRIAVQRTWDAYL